MLKEIFSLWYLLNHKFSQPLGFLYVTPLTELICVKSPWHVQIKTSMSSLIDSRSQLSFHFLYGYNLMEIIWLSASHLSFGWESVKTREKWPFSCPFLTPPPPFPATHTTKVVILWHSSLVNATVYCVKLTFNGPHVVTVTIQLGDRIQINFKVCHF